MGLEFFENALVTLPDAPQEFRRRVVGVVLIGGVRWRWQQPELELQPHLQEWSSLAQIVVAHQTRHTGK